MQTYRILFLIFFIPLNLRSNIYLNIYFVQPLEITLGRLNLEKTQKQEPQRVVDLNIANFIFYGSSTNQTFFRSFSYQTQSPLSYYSNSFYNKSSFINLEWIPFLNINNVSWLAQNKELNFRASLSYGLSLNKDDTFAAFLGFLNEQKVHNQILSQREPIIEYGKVFFIPGIQLRSQSVILKTFLEIPLYEYDLITRTQKIYPIHYQDAKANFQIQIKN
ncbi:MAG: hypothetical protein ACK4UJ_02300 [Leptonema sp. (in: bacteria)]